MPEFQTFHVANVMPTGETHEKFGKEFYIKFAESEDTFKLWTTKEYTEGQELQGNIVDGKFKKYKAPYDGSTKSSTPYKKPYGAVQADKNDGQRQGMCINNAANYVNATQGDKLEANDWATMVHAFAQALYNKGNLTSTSDDEVVTDDVANVKNIFGVK